MWGGWGGVVCVCWVWLWLGNVSGAESGGLAAYASASTDESVSYSTVMYDMTTLLQTHLMC